MDQSKALQRLTESADLVGMIEDLVRTAQSERLSAATMAGMRITLRNIRDSILASHDLFASELVSRNRSRTDLNPPAQAQTAESMGQESMQSGDSAYPGSSAATGSTFSDPTRLGIRRHSLRATLEKVAE
ncbi:MAG: hypothetical protein EBZ48_03255 [Proteobacteria bacterium]|nr:hypothetical protein [Pseudomonadota bacterium]